MFRMPVWQGWVGTMRYLRQWGVVETTTTVPVLCHHRPIIICVANALLVK